jgi:AraC-like DNA-binding protein
MLNGTELTLRRATSCADPLAINCTEPLASRNAPCAWPARGGLAPWQTKRLVAYVRENIGKRMKAYELAALVKLSTSHFQRAFKVSFQQTPAIYITQQRMRVAQCLMLTTAYPLARISLECGLCDQAHFSRLFRRVMGQSPQLWRRQFTADPSPYPTPEPVAPENSALQNGARGLPSRPFLVTRRHQWAVVIDSGSPAASIAASNQPASAPSESSANGPKRKLARLAEDFPPAP